MNTLSPHAQALPSRSADPKRKHGIRFMNLMDGRKMEKYRIERKFITKLKNLKGFTWASVTNLVKEFLPDYIRTTEELAKDKLLADREVPEVAKLFPKIGIQVVQDESFYVEPKKESDAVQTA